MIIPHIFTSAYREEVFLQYMIDHYRTRFPGCLITVYDNQSPDKTAEIARNNGCEIIEFNSNGMIDDFKLRNLKNNCWKNAKTEWVLVCDVDELLDIDANKLEEEDKKGTTIIKSQAFNMVNMNNDFEFDNIKYGTRVEQYDKSYLFKRNMILDINYNCGGHSANPKGIVQYSAEPYKLYHYKCINPDYLVERYKWTADRLSPENKKNKMGLYWIETEENIRKGFESGRESAKNMRVKS